MPFSPSTTGFAENAPAGARAIVGRWPRTPPRSTASTRPVRAHPQGDRSAHPRAGHRRDWAGSSDATRHRDRPPASSATSRASRAAPWPRRGRTPRSRALPGPWSPGHGRRADHGGATADRRGAGLRRHALPLRRDVSGARHRGFGRRALVQPRCGADRGLQSRGPIHPGRRPSWKGRATATSGTANHADQGGLRYSGSACLARWRTSCSAPRTLSHSSASSRPRR